MQSFILVEGFGFGFPAFGKPKQKFYPNTKKMKNNSYFIFKLSIALLIIFASSFSYGQEIRNNNQTETLQLPVKKIVRYFDNFNLHYLTDYELTETKIDSITHNKNITTLYFTENKNYKSAIIVTNLNKYQKTIKEKSFETNLLMLFKGEFSAETLKHPIKPVINESFSKEGTLKWKINIETLDENLAKLTFIFDSFDKKHKQKFISNFSKGIDKNFNYTVQQIFVTENFKRDVLNYLAKSSKADANGVQPTKGN